MSEDLIQKQSLVHEMIRDKWLVANDCPEVHHVSFHKLYFITQLNHDQILEIRIMYLFLNAYKTFYCSWKGINATSGKWKATDIKSQNHIEFSRITNSALTYLYISTKILKHFQKKKRVGRSTRGRKRLRGGKREQ